MRPRVVVVHPPRRCRVPPARPSPATPPASARSRCGRRRGAAGRRRFPQGYGGFAEDGRGAGGRGETGGRAHVLEHQPQREARVEAAAEDEPWPFDLGGAAAPAGAVHRLQHGRGVQSEGRAGQQRFGRDQQMRRGHQVVEGFERVPRAGRTDVRHLGTEHAEQWPGLRQLLLGAACHDGERALPGAEDPAGDRGVHQAHPVSGGRRGQFPGPGRFGRAHVDDESAGLQPADQAVAEQGTVHGGGVGQHQYDGVGAPYRLLGAVHHLDTVFPRGEPGTGAGGGVVSAHLVTGGGEAAGHRGAHAAQAEETDHRRGLRAGHGVPPGRCRRRGTLPARQGHRSR